MNTTNVNSQSLSKTLEAAPKAKKEKGKKSVEEQASEFQGELAQAGIAQPQSQLKVPAMDGQNGGTEKAPGSDPKPVGKGEMESRAEFSQTGLNLNKGAQMKAMAQATGPDSESFLANTERFPQIQKAAASLNTGAAIAGLKPWSKDWVFEGRPQPGAQPIQPLFAPKDEQPGSLAELEQLIAAAAVQAGMEEAPGTMQDVPGALPAGGFPKVARNAQEVRDDLDTQDILRQMRSGADITTPGMQGGVNATDLTGLNGNLEASGLKTSHAGSAPKGSAAGVSALSGAEFLSTLNAVRDNSAAGAALQSGQSGWNGTSGEGQQGREERQGQAGIGSRPDFRVIDGGAKDKRKVEFGQDASAAQLGVSTLAVDRLGKGDMVRPPLTVTGHVTQGAMAQNRLSSESLLGLSNGIREIKAQGGGEIRVRLKPENLGELHLRVVTNGSNVGLQIQASDNHAKKVIEETLSHLKDSLASQNLSLGRVELTVAPAAQGSESDASRRQDQGQQPQGQQAWQDMMGQSNPNGQQGRSEHWSSVDPDAYPIGPAKSSARKTAVSSTGLAAEAGRSRAMDSNQRIDVMA